MDSYPLIINESNDFMNLSKYVIYIYVVLNKIYQMLHLKEFYNLTLKINIMNKFKILNQTEFSTGNLEICRWLVPVVFANNKNWMRPFPLSLV